MLSGVRFRVVATPGNAITQRVNPGLKVTFDVDIQIGRVGGSCTLNPKP